MTSEYMFPLLLMDHGDSHTHLPRRKATPCPLHERGVRGRLRLLLKKPYTDTRSQ